MRHRRVRRARFDLRGLETSFADVAEAILQVAFETSLDEPLQPRRRALRQDVHRQRVLQHRGQGLGDILALESALASEHLVSTTPKAQMSARLSTVLPFACSGDM